MRRRIAENIAESARRVAHFSYVEEVDVTAIEELRASVNARSIPPTTVSNRIPREVWVCGSKKIST